MALDDLRSALDDVIAAEARDAPPPAARRAQSAFQVLDDEDARLPPIRRAAPRPATVAEALTRSGAEMLVPLWYVAREVVVVGGLCWLAVLLLAFGAGVEDLAAPLVAAVAVRAVWLTVPAITPLATATHR